MFRQDFWSIWTLWTTIDTSISQSIDQLVSTWFTESTQSKHFLEEYKSLKKYNSHYWPEVWLRQLGSCCDNHCIVSGRSLTEYILFSVQYPRCCFMSTYGQRGCYFLLFWGKNPHQDTLQSKQHTLHGTLRSHHEYLRERWLNYNSW